MYFRVVYPLPLIQRTISVLSNASRHVFRSCILIGNVGGDCDIPTSLSFLNFNPVNSTEEVSSESHLLVKSVQQQII